jgi:hypothetical protein
MLGQSRSDSLSAQPGKAVIPATGSAPAPAPVPAADKRVVAYVYENTAITREEFGDYLIEHYGRDRIRMFVNRKIIENAAAKRNIVVTPQEIDAIIDQDCGKLGVKKEEFIKFVLTEKYRMTLREWREDVIRPRLIMQAMCKDQIKIDDEQLQKVYENLYGEKVQCKIILWPQEQKRDVMKMYDSLKNDPKAYDEMARSQLYGDLGKVGGIVDPIGRFSGPGTAKVEEIAFQLKDGQVSEIIDTGGGIMLIKRIQSIPAKKEVSFESVKPALMKELMERLMEQEIPKMFAKLSEEAKPHFILTPLNETKQDLDEKSRRLGVDPGRFEKK